MGNIGLREFRVVNLPHVSLGSPLGLWRTRLEVYCWHSESQVLRPPLRKLVPITAWTHTRPHCSVCQGVCSSTITNLVKQPTKNHYVSIGNWKVNGKKAFVDSNLRSDEKGPCEKLEVVEVPNVRWTEAASELSQLLNQKFNKKKWHICSSTMSTTTKTLHQCIHQLTY